MAIIQSGASADLATIDATSKAVRVTAYNSSGTELGTASAPTIIKIQSRATTDTQTIDPTSKAARTTLYDSSGNELTCLRPSSLAITVTAASGSAATLTIPAVASQFHYITLLEIRQYAAAGLTGGATPVLVTSTNLPGSLVWTFKTVLGVGDTEAQIYSSTTPLKSSVSNTNTTIVAPATTNVIWRITAWYIAAV